MDSANHPPPRAGLMGGQEDRCVVQEDSSEAARQYLGAWSDLTPGSNKSLIHDLSGIAHWETCTHRQKGIPELGLATSMHNTNTALVFSQLDFCEQWLCSWK